MQIVSGKTMRKGKTNLTVFGCRVKKRLIDKDMTQAELAEAIGTTTQYLYKIFTGQRSGGKYIEAIQRVLEMKSTL